jgi:hypothetical protein
MPSRSQSPAPPHNNNNKQTKNNKDINHNNNKRDLLSEFNIEITSMINFLNNTIIPSYNNIGLLILLFVELVKLLLLPSILVFYPFILVPLRMIIYETSIWKATVGIMLYLYSCRLVYFVAASNHPKLRKFQLSCKKILCQTSGLLDFLFHPQIAYTIFIKNRKLKEITDRILENKAQDIYVIPIDVFLTWTTFPKHEDVVFQLEKRNLKSWQIPDNPRRDSDVLFAMHACIEQEQFESDIKCVFHRVKKRLLRMENSSYEAVWFDFTCIPNDSMLDRQAHLLSVPDILRRCDVDLFTHPDNVAFNYSIWVQIGLLFNCQYPKNFSSIDSWNMLNKNDLQFLLPGIVRYYFCSWPGGSFWLNCHETGYFSWMNARAKTLSIIMKWYLDHL